MSWKANLAKTDESRGNLPGDDLREADLREAKVPEATRKGTRLAGADPSGSALRRDNLRAADLSEAALQATTPRASKRRHAELTRADRIGAGEAGATLPGAPPAGPGRRPRRLGAPSPPRRSRRAGGDR